MRGKKVPKKINAFRTDDERRADLERYRLMAIELGATDAEVIKSDQVIVEDRVQGKCRVPICYDYGKSINCPPYSPTAENMRSMIGEYRCGIFIRLVVPSTKMVGERATEEDAMAASRRKLHEIVSEIESQAFYDGYHLAMGFAGGSCKRTFCADLECNALTPGKGCRHPLLARPSMESAGMDAFAMAAKVGWDIYPIGRTVCVDDVPHGTRLGLVLID